MIENEMIEELEFGKRQNEMKECLFCKKEIPMLEDVQEKLNNELGVKFFNLEGIETKIQQLIPESIEKMYQEFPEIKGYIASVKSGKLRDGVLACSGPCITENGYEGAEIVFNKNFFGKRGCEIQISEMDSARNWRNERWLAGKGVEGVINHEIGHVLALKLNADDAQIEIGDNSHEKCKLLNKLYENNSRTSKLCYDSLVESGVSPKDIGRELSIYGATDFGETFAEAISEVTTRKRPRPYAQTVVNNYRKLVNKENVEVA